MTTTSKGQQAAQDINALLRARNHLIWVVTREEGRAERFLIEAAAAAGYVPRTWDVAQGVCDLSGKPQPFGANDPDTMLDYIKQRATGTAAKERGVWIMRDLPPWLVSGPIGAGTIRRLKNIAREAAPRESAQAVIILTSSTEVPPELSGEAVVIEWPIPDRTEMDEILGVTIEMYPKECADLASDPSKRSAAVDAALGMTGSEAEACYARSLVQYKRVDPIAVGNEKKRIISREKVLEWVDPIPGGLEAVGGLEALKAWLLSRASGYSPQARKYGLPYPKGIFLVGPPGSGKTLVAKAIATALACPLVRLDMGALKSKFVGDSERLIRAALRVIDVLGKCVVWIDRYVDLKLGELLETPKTCEATA